MTDAEKAAKEKAEAEAAAKAKAEADAKAKADAEAAAAANDDADDDDAEDDDDEGIVKKVGKDGVVMLPRNAFKKIKDSARVKGEKTAQTALEDRAKKMGYKSADEMYAAAEAEAKRRAEAAAKAKAEADDDDEPTPEQDEEEDEAPRKEKKGEDKRFLAIKAERETLRKEKERLERELRHEKRTKAAIEREKTRVEGEAATRIEALKQGVKDPDYVVTLLEREISKMDEEEVKKFDKAKWYESLKEDKPYLFGEIIRPANTGTGPNGANPPKPGQVDKKTVQNGKKAVKEMNPAEFREHLRAMGIDPFAYSPGTGKL